MMRLVFYGDLNVDLVAVPGEQQLVFRAYPGGSAFNTASTVGRLGFPIRFISEKGNDFLGEYLTQALKQYRVDDASLITPEGFKTFLTIADINPQGNADYVLYKHPKPETFPISQVQQSWFRDADWFHFASTSSFSERNAPAVMQFLEWASHHDLIVSMDPNVRMRTFDNRAVRSRFESYFPYVTLLKISDEDLDTLYGCKTVQSCLHVLKEIPVPMRILTLGKQGSILLIGQREIIGSVQPVEVVNTIGAGDNFTAGLMMACERSNVSNRDSFLNQADEMYRKWLHTANMVGSLACQSAGGVLDDDIMEKIVHEFKK